MATIPSKQLHRSGSKSALLANLSPREIGFCEDDKRCYICIIDPTKTPGDPDYKKLYLIGRDDDGIQEPTRVSLLAGSTTTENGPEHGVYGWKFLTKATDPNTGSTLWYSLQNPEGPGDFQFRAYVAEKDTDGNSIAQTFGTILDGLDVLIDRLFINKIPLPTTEDYILISSIGSVNLYVQKPSDETYGEFLKVYCAPKSIMDIAGMATIMYPSRIISGDAAIMGTWSTSVNILQQEVSEGSRLKIATTSGIDGVLLTGDNEPFVIDGWITAGLEQYHYIVDYRGGYGMGGYYVKVELV